MLWRRESRVLDELRIDRRRLERLIALAREEDLGPHGDLTSLLLPETRLHARGQWQLTPRAAGRFCGRPILKDLLILMAPMVTVEWIDPRPDNQPVEPGEALARLAGPWCQMLAAERILLNLLQRLSGVATLTAQYVSAVAGTAARIFDTRKTTPGMRDLERYAVRCGGGHNHRSGLYDAVLIKDNHLAGIPTDRLAHAVFDLLNRLQALPAAPSFVEVECDDLVQFSELLKVVGINVILLDNFTPEDLREAVQRRDDAGLRGRLELEASGGVTLDTVRAVAEIGVERIAVGALTHSAPVLDIGLDAVA